LSYINATEPDKWFSQQNEFDNAAAVVYNLISVFDVKISKTTIYHGLTDEPGYPSLIAIKNFLGKWDFEVAIAEIHSKTLAEVEYPLIAWMKKDYYVVLMDCVDNEIKYIDPKRGWVVEKLNVFVSKWSGIVIDMVPGEMSFEKDYEEKVESEKIERKKNAGGLKVSVIDDFLTPEECDYLIELSQPKYEHSKTMKNNDGREIHEGRTSFTAFLNIKDKLVDDIYAKGARILGIPIENFEYLQCTSYDENQEYRRHHDAFSKTEKDTLKFGQRISTILIYLNDDFTGGGTYFPLIDIRVRPKKGSAAVWHNLLENGERDSDVYHAGLPVIEGKKYISNLWARNQNCNK
jgi:hypothetical protein